MSQQSSVALLGLMMVLLAGCGDQGSTGTEAGAAQSKVIALPDRVIYVAEKRTFQPRFELPAVTEALQSAKMKPEVRAPIKTNHFRAGQLVEKGELLVELDPSKYVARLDSAQAVLNGAKADRLKAAATWERAKKLKPKGYISEQDYDLARATISTSDARVAQAEAELDRAELDMQHTKIHAPFNGKISKPGHAVGNLVGPLAVEPLFELVQLDPIYAVTSVALKTYNQFIARRMQLEEEGVDIPDVEVSLRLAGDTVYPHTGTFEAWSHTSRSSQGAIAGRVLFPNPRGQLLPGQNVTVVGEMIEKLERVMVPQKAVMQDQQGHYVKFVSEDGTVARKNLKPGLRVGSDWAVLEGLEVGDRVIVEGAAALRAGTPVKINESP